MKPFNIRDRLLLAAVLPVMLVAIGLSAVLLAGRYADFDEAHQQQARSLVRQLASASEYGLFSGNATSLYTIAASAMRESDVRAVLILDARGEIMASAGWAGRHELPVLGAQEQRWRDSRTGSEWLVQPVQASRVRLDELYDGGAAAADPQAPLLGHVVLAWSRAAVVARGRNMLLIGLAVTFVGLLFGGALAVGLGRGVIRPILRVSDMIRRIGRGELSVRMPLQPDDPLRDLQQGLNQMAERLEQGREELAQRVAQATAELRARKEEAERATRAKSRFLAAASHDLRQPMHALGMFVARLAQLPHDQETRHLVRNLDASVRAMQDLLDALLDISRLEAEAIQAHVHAFPLEHVLEALRSGMLPVALERRLALRVRGCGLWVHSDPALLHRILLNLVGNALRYTRRGGVLVGCRRSCDGRHVRIEVWDTGIGIAPQHQQEIFKEFYQVDNPERDRSKGLGLGLSIVDRIARLLGHPLQLCSLPGRGTRFRIEVPLAAADSQGYPQGPVEPVAVDELRGARVLVVEDDGQSAQALRELLVSWGCVVVAVEGLRQGLASVAEGFRPDLILSDYRLRAGETGLAVHRQLQAMLGAPVPTCLMTGDTDPGLMQSCRDAGLPLLHKPVRPAKLRTLMRRLIRKT